MGAEDEKIINPKANHQYGAVDNYDAAADGGSDKYVFLVVVLVVLWMIQLNLICCRLLSPLKIVEDSKHHRQHPRQHNSTILFWEFCSSCWVCNWEKVKNSRFSHFLIPNIFSCFVRDRFLFV